jgi:hypothetical protein
MLTCSLIIPINYYEVKKYKLNYFIKKLIIFVIKVVQLFENGHF